MKNCGNTFVVAVRILVLMIFTLSVADVLAVGRWERLEEKPPVRMRLATTTSTENSGLLDYLLPPFEKKHHVTIDVVAVGTGQALEIGRNGDADILMVHAPELEKEFVREGHGIRRAYFMYNDFIILGPQDDPAGIRGMSKADQAFKKIAQGNFEFISRGDNSGTHVKELFLWKEAAGSPDFSLYREVGQGMGAVITLSNDRQAYTLADRGTYLSYQADVALDILVEGDEVLFNPYGVIALNSERHPHVKKDLAVAFTEYCISNEAQKIIDDFTVNGQQIFFSVSNGKE